MNIIFLSIILILTILILCALIILIIKTEKENKEKTQKTVYDILEEKNFFPKEVLYINRKLSIALNKQETKLAIIENLNPNNPTYYSYWELATSYIEKIEKSAIIKIHYYQRGELKVLNIYPASNNIKNFIHQVFKKACLARIENKFPQYDFNITSASDWNCNYVWAFSKRKTTFAYYMTTGNPVVFKFNILKEHFTIDTQFKYLEVPIFGLAQQLFLYEKTFLSELLDDLTHEIKITCNTIIPNMLYYDSFNNIIYLSNGISSLQSILLNKVEEIAYRENRISFILNNDNKQINFVANQKMVKDFENFITNYNLQKIAQNFDHKSDKLINTTQYTKCIIDSTRDRIIYCANTNKLSSFNYMVINFLDIFDIRTETSGTKNFVRIQTRDKETIDISCDKKEVALYIEAQVKKILFQ